MSADAAWWLLAAWLVYVVGANVTQWVRRRRAARYANEVFHAGGIKQACEECGDRDGPWGLSKEGLFLCEACLEKHEPWEFGGARETA